MEKLTRLNLIGASLGAALVAVPLTTQFALAADGASAADLKIINSAIELERAAIKAYNDAAATGKLSAPVIVVAQGFIKDHSNHRDALIAAVRSAGGTPSDATAQLTYPALNSQADILVYAESLERQAALAYLAGVQQLQSRQLQAAAASIMGDETTHVAILSNALSKGSAYPSGFVS